MSPIICIIAVSLFFVLLLFKVFQTEISGWWGEQKVSTLLSMLNANQYAVFNDVLVQHNGRSSQIDHVVVSPFGVFVIETKNYKGWIYGGRFAQYWTQNIWGNKHRLFNPILQNQGHINALKRVLPTFHEKQFISVVVFSSKASLMSSLPRECNVITTSKLNAVIRSYTDTILTCKEVDELKHAIDMLTLFSKKEKEQHVSYARNSAQRSSQLMNYGICPRCGGKLVKRSGKYGDFVGCSNYPNCKFTA